MSRFKIFASSLCTAALLLGASFTTQAQQLPNNGFEGEWKTCTPWTGGYGTKTIGENPESWCISHVMGITSGFLAGIGKKAMGEKTAGYNSPNAVKVFNEETGAAGITRVVPGYVTLGTTWSTAEGTNEKTHDGGTWGGIPFTKRPDAVTFYYKREFNGTNKSENASFIAYLWKGTWTQANVPVTITTTGSPKTTTMTNRDRKILGGDYSATTTGGAVTSTADAELIASVVEIEAKEVTNWTEKTIEINYISDEAPTMLNIIFSANEYFNTKSATKGNSLYIDDVKLVYYSRLASLFIDDKPVSGFNSDTYVYDFSTQPLPDNPQNISYELVGQGKSAKVGTPVVDRTNGTIKITVTGVDIDTDEATSHTYTLNFKPAPIQLSSISINDKVVGSNVENGATINTELPFTTNKDAFTIEVDGKKTTDFTLGDREGTNEKPTVTLSIEHPITKEKNTYTLVFLPYKAEIDAIKLKDGSILAVDKGTSNIKVNLDYSDAVLPESVTGASERISGAVTLSNVVEATDFNNPVVTITVENKDGFESVTKKYTLVYNPPAAIKLSSISINDQVVGSNVENGATIKTELPFTNDKEKFTIKVDGKETTNFTLGPRTGTNEEPKLTLTIPHPAIPNSNNTYTLVFLPYKAELTKIILANNRAITINNEDTEIATGVEYSESTRPSKWESAPISGTLDVKFGTVSDPANPKLTVTVTNTEANPQATKEYTLVYNTPAAIKLSSISINDKVVGSNVENGATINTELPFTTNEEDFTIEVDGKRTTNFTLGPRTGTNEEPKLTLTIPHPAIPNSNNTYTLVFLPYKAELQSITVGGKKLEITGNRIVAGVEYTPANHPKSAGYNDNTSGTVTVAIEETVKDPAKPEITVTVTNNDAIGGPMVNTYTLVYNPPAAIKLSSISINDQVVGSNVENGATINTELPFTTNKKDFTIEVNGNETTNFTLGTRTGSNEEPKLTLTIPHPVIPNSSNTYTLVFLPYKAEIDEIELKNGYTAHVNEGTTDIKVDADYSDAVLPVSVTGASERISGAVNLINVVKATDMNNPVVTITVENKDGFEAVTKEYRVIYHSPISSRISGVIISGTTYPVGEENIIDISARPLPMPAIADITPVYILPDNNQTSKITLNTETGTGTITVTNSEGADYDGKKSHEYTLKFAQVNLSRPKGITIMNASNTKALTLKPVFNSKTYTYEANGNRHDENIGERIKFEWFDGKELKIETATEGDEYNDKEPKLLITVTNPAGGKDYDGEESHTYTFIFNPRTHDNRSVSLESITVNGAAVPDFNPDVFDYELPYGIVAKDKIEWALLAYEDHPTDGTVARIDIDENAAVATIHVSNEISNSDGEDERTYTLHFLPYYSRLAGINAPDGTRIETFEETGEKINVTVPGQIPKRPYTEQEILASLIFPQATAGTISKELTVTMETVTATLTVSNEKPDVDGLSAHTYILKYDAPFYSRLESLKIENVDVPGFNRNTFSYTVDAQMPANPTITPTIIRGSNSAGKAEIKQRSADAEKALVTVVVTNTEPDIDGKSSHTYTVQYLLPYFSRLEALTIGGEAVASLPQDNKTPIVYPGFMPESDDAVKELFGYTFKKGSGTPAATVAIDRSTATARITVTNGGQKDIDNRTNHVYIVQFTLPYLSTASSITVDGEEIPGFSSDNHEYTLSGQMPAQDRIEVEASKGNGESTCIIESDAETATVTITVTNSGDEDGNNASTTTYTLHYDLPYFSRLEALAIGGEEVAELPQDGKTPVAYSGFMPESDDAVKELFGYTFKKGSGNPAATVAVDRSTATARITVTNGGQKDLDGKTSHVYIIQFTLPYLSTASSITVDGEEIPGFSSDNHEYTLSGQMPAQDNIAVELSKGNGEATYQIESDAETATVTITVTNSGDAEGNNASTTTYTLHYDLPYFSRLEALAIGGEEVAELPQDGKTPVAYSGFMPESDDAVKELFDYTFKNGSGNPVANVTIDRSNATATITVTNGGQKDLDGKTSHVYIVQFTLPYLSTASSITVDGKKIAGFAPDKYEYTLSGQMPADANIAVEPSKGNGEATYRIESDGETATVTITVTNSGDAEGNHGSTTTYILHFDLPYFSRLEALTIGEQEFTELPQDGVTPINYSGLLPDTNDAASKLFSYTFKKGSGNPAARVAFDRSKFTATITVTNGGQKDLDGKTSHIYIVQFALPYYSTAASITIGGESIPGFSPAQSDYTVSGQMPASDQIGVELTQGSGNATYSIASDAETATITITVTNSGDAEGNNASTTTYTLHFDLPYFSRLASLKVRGEEVPGFDRDKFEYTLPGALPAQSEIAGTAMQGSGRTTVSVTRDTAEGIATVTVTNSGGNDLDGKSTHTYTLNFDKPVNSRLTSISIDGTPVPNFDTNTFSYNLTSLAMPAEGTVTAVSANPDATISIDYNTAKSIVTIKVSAEGMDEDGETYHTYTLSFKKETPKPVEGTTTEYSGKLTIMMMGEDLTGGGQDAKVVIKKGDDGTCTFMLPDFSLDLGDGPASLGDIVVENVTMTPDGKGGYTYSGDVKGLELAEGAIVADVTLTGTTDAEGNAHMIIKVLWEGIDIDVEFNGVRTSEENPNPGPEPTEKWNSFDGTLSIEMAGSYLAENQPATVYITDPVNGKCTFKLPDFSIDLDGTELALGDIVVENVDVSEENGITTYSGFVPQMSFLDGEIIADINLKGTVDADGKAHMTIQVLWEGIEINVEFNGNRNPEENPNPGPEPSDEWNDFDGTLSIEMAGSYLAENQPATIYITDPINGKCTFKLPDFSIDLDGTELALGDIVVENVDVSEENGITTYSGFVPQMSFLDGEIIADINLKGTVDADGKAHMTIQVLWEGIEINVEFNGNRNEIAWLTFPGKLTIALEGYDITEGGKDAVVKIARTGENGLYTFLLPDFSIALDAESAPAQLGDIQIDNITMTPNDGFDRYTGKVERMVLAGGDIVAGVKVDGTITTASEVRINVDVTWYMEDGKRVPILVKFINTEDIPATPERAVYTGTLTTETEGAVKDHNVRIHMTPSYGNRSDLLIEGIDLAGSRAAAIGNSISVPSVSITAMSNGYKAYDGAATSVQVQPGMTLDINLHGVSDRNNKFNLLMDIEWLEEGISISGKFNGEVDVTGIAPIVSPEDNDGKEEYYNINGVRVYPDNLRPGIYIRRKGNKSEKIIIK